MTDYTDDWMNPQRSAGWSYTPREGTEFVVERCRRVPVTGNVAFIQQWDVWSVHDTAEERDRELEELRERHPVWRLRSRNISPLDRIARRS